MSTTYFLLVYYASPCGVALVSTYETNTFLQTSANLPGSFLEIFYACSFLQNRPRKFFYGVVKSSFHPVHNRGIGRFPDIFEAPLNATATS
mmetsp:Transcript_18455/g.56650  ORF Transcript_18455/g.56650 Transcript_18455/m.56650 type:complete len:91 (+) Transcript_18455:1680-1952(+)